VAKRRIVVPSSSRWTHRPRSKNGWGNSSGFPSRCAGNHQNGFPDDRAAFGPTITSEAQSARNSKWFPGLSLESLRRRFRSNLELAGGEPFCEDRLFGAHDEFRSFQIGCGEIFRP